MTYGIGIGPFGTLVESCTVRTIGTQGIVAGVVKNCCATDCGVNGIGGYEISDCIGESINGGTGISANYGAYRCNGKSVSGAGLR